MKQLATYYAPSNGARQRRKLSARLKTIPLYVLAGGAAIFASAFASEEVVAAPEQTTQEALSAPVTLKNRPLQDYEQWRSPAPSDSRSASDYEDNYANDAGDALFFSPGVWINALDIYEPRISLRGFSIGNRQERTGPLVLRDGAPLTDVHGSTDLKEIDLLAVARVDVFRGGGGSLRWSGDNLGGALNYVSPTGLTAASGMTARADIGSSVEGSPGGRLHTDFAGVSRSGDIDYFASLSGGYESGFRDNNELQYGIFNGNVGYRISPKISTRFFVEAIYNAMEHAGGLLPADALADPSQSAPAISLGPLFPGGPVFDLAESAEADHFSRDIFVGRISNQTLLKLFGHDVEVGLHFARRDVESPQIDFVGVLEEAGNEWGARLAVSRDIEFFNIETTYRVGGSYSTGSKISDRFENLNGAKGDQLIDTEHQSTNITAFVEAALRPFKNLLVDMGAKFIIADRELTVDDDATPEEVRHTGVAARLGVIYDFLDNAQIFVTASRTYETPTFSELISDNPEDLNGLDEQDAFTYEAGVRGSLNDWIGWDVTYFNADVENEIINIEEPETNGVGSTFVNVDSTEHKGFEAGIDINFMPLRNGQSLTLRNAYSYNDFRFVDAGPLGAIDGNRLAGIPQHVYRGELRYDQIGEWFAAVNVQVAGGSFYADHENLVTVPTYAVVGFSAGMQLTDQVVIFASGENITNLDYAGGVTPVLSQTLQNGRIFTPASRASVYGGLKYRF